MTMNRMLSRCGARLGNWNDRVNGRANTRALRPRRWRVIDRIASRLYVRGDRGRRAPRRPDDE